MLDVSGSEPFVFTERISAWPTVAIRLLALVMSLLFLWYSWRKMKNNENVLTHELDLQDKGTSLLSILPYAIPKKTPVTRGSRSGSFPTLFDASWTCMSGVHKVLTRSMLFASGENISPLAL